MATKYGIISDIHTSRPSNIDVAIRTLVRKGAEKFILNGDLVGDQTPADPVKYLGTVLKFAAATHKEVYVQPGSHEEVVRYKEAVQGLRGTFSNLIDMTQTPLVQTQDHDLVFLPGSDWYGGHVEDRGYHLQRNVPTGEFINQRRGFAYATNLNDLKKYVRDPEKTIVICHVPAKFDSLEHGVDMAYFAESGRGLMPGIVLENQIREQFGKLIPYEQVQEIAAQNGFTFKTENRGNQGLADLFKEIGITKAINGHFHESAHHAHDEQCNPVAQGELHKGLFWNASYLDGGKVGLLTVDGNKVSYENIQL